VKAITSPVYAQEDRARQWRPVRSRPV